MMRAAADMPTFRPMVAADRPMICTFAGSAEELSFCFPGALFPLTVEQLAKAIEQRHGVTVIEHQERVRGMADLYRRSDGGWAIGHVLIDGKARGLGLGRALIIAMTDLARRVHQAERMYVSCFGANTAGLLLYHSLGFTPWAMEERRDQLGRRTALIHFRGPCG